MFPHQEAEIKKAVQKANNAINGADESQASNIAQSFGITPQGINEMYNKFGNDPRAKLILGLAGTSPDKLKTDALNIVNSQDTAQVRAKSKPETLSRFPRLK